jgi:uncharacterized protein YxjI
MGLLRNRTDEPGGVRFLMREKLLSIGDDFWIENEAGERAYKVDGKAVRVRQTFVLEDASGDEVARIQERKLSIRDKVAVERDGDTLATIHKALVGIRDRFSIDVEDGDDLKAHGNVVDHEYEIERDGDTSRRSPRSGSACGSPTASTWRQTPTSRSSSRSPSPSTR